MSLSRFYPLGPWISYIYRCVTWRCATYSFLALLFFFWIHLWRANTPASTSKLSSGGTMWRFFEWALLGTFWDFVLSEHTSEHVVIVIFEVFHDSCMYIYERHGKGNIELRWPQDRLAQKGIHIKLYIGLPVDYPGSCWQYFKSCSRLWLNTIYNKS